MIAAHDRAPVSEHVSKSDMELLQLLGRQAEAFVDARSTRPEQSLEGHKSLQETNDALLNLIRQRHGLADAPELATQQGFKLLPPDEKVWVALQAQQIAYLSGNDKALEDANEALLWWSKKIENTPPPAAE